MVFSLVPHGEGLAAVLDLLELLLFALQDAGSLVGPVELSRDLRRRAGNIQLPAVSAGGHESSLFSRYARHLLIFDRNRHGADQRLAVPRLDGGLDLVSVAGRATAVLGRDFLGGVCIIVDRQASIGDHADKA